jgi:hypothetical protein
MGEKITKAQREIVSRDPIAARLVAKLAPADNGCWLWTGCKNEDGYGTAFIDGKGRKVHREMYARFNGPFPPGMFVCHHCDTPSCGNPAHLFAGTARDNMRDMVAKGRAVCITSEQAHFRAGHSPRGEATAAAKLTEDDVREIVRLRRSGIGSTAIGKQYGVNRTTIQRLLNGQTWGHVAGRAALSEAETLNSGKEGA